MGDFNSSTILAKNATARHFLVEEIRKIPSLEIENTRDEEYESFGTSPSHEMVTSPSPKSDDWTTWSPIRLPELVFDDSTPSSLNFLKYCQRDNFCQYSNCRIGTSRGTCRNCLEDTLLFGNDHSPELFRILRFGEDVGRKIRRVSVPEPPREFYFNLEATDRSRLLRQMLQHLHICGLGEAAYCYSSNFVSTNVLIQWIIETIFLSAGLSNYRTFHKYYGCAEKSFIIVDSLNSKRVLDEFAHSEVPANFIASTWLQLCLMLEKLSNFSFNLGRPSIDKVHCSERLQLLTTPSGRTITIGPIIFFNDLSRSTITRGGATIFSYDVQAESLMKRRPFVSSINSILRTVRRCSLNQNNEMVCASYLTYRLDFDDIVFMTWMSHAGIALFSGSFDLYAILVSMMLNESVYIAVMGDNRLSQAWQAIWEPEQLAELERRIRLAHSQNRLPQDFPTLLDILRDMELRCDVLNILLPYLWKMF